MVRNLTSNELAAVACAAHLRGVDCGRLFYREGSTADEVFVMNRGRLTLIQSSSELHRGLLRFISPGEVFGTMGLVEGQAYPVSAQAVC